MQINIEHEVEGFERVVRFTDEKIGLDMIISVHNTKRGAALGGTRIRNYKDYHEMLDDALSLSSAMTYKAAMAGLNYGGGKVVINSSSPNFNRKFVLKSLASALNEFKGTFYTGVDAGSSITDISFLRKHTQYVDDPTDIAFEPSQSTAYGVYLGILECLDYFAFLHGGYYREEYEILIQGCGKVGYNLIKRLKSNKNFSIIISDIDENKVKKICDEFEDIRVVHPDKIFETECDIFSPCAYGNIINEENIEKINKNENGCAIICGAANNQLVDEECGKLLCDMDILYAPDYVVNAGGLIAVVLNRYTNDIWDVIDKIGEIPHTLNDIFMSDGPTNIIADEMAKKILEGK